MDQQNEAKSNNWRNERLAQMLDTGMGVDVYFLVGKPDEEKQLISANKFMLSAASDVFQGQFYRFDQATGTQEGSEEKPIEVPDIGPDAFRAMLKYIYAEDLSGVNKQIVLDIYSAGKKYMIDALVNACRQWLLNGTNLGVDNVLAALKHAQFHEDKILIEHCWTFVDKNIREILLKSEGFFELNQTDLCELFGRDTLETDELFLFQRLIDWAVDKCVGKRLEKTPENAQKMIGDAIYQIRFPLFTLQQFTKFIAPFGLLTKEDMLAMYLHYGNNNSSAEEAKVYDNDTMYASYSIPLSGKERFDRIMNAQYQNRFNCQPRAFKFCIDIAVLEEASH